MKHYNFCMAILLALMIPFITVSCSSSSTDDAKKLLETVPADAHFVVVSNVGNLLEKSGIKENPDKVLPSHIDKDVRTFFKSVIAGEAGIKFTSAVFYGIGDNFVATVRLDNASKFKDAMKKADSSISFSESDGYTTTMDGVFIFNDKQLWICNIKPGSMSRITTAKKKDSFAAAVKNYDKMMNLEEDLSLLTSMDNLASLVSDRGNKQSAMGLSMGLGMVGDDIKYFSANGDIDKDHVNIEGQLFNSKGEPAKSNLKLQKINPSVLTKNLCANDIVAAIGLDQAFFDKILNLASTFAGDTSEAKAILKNISGTAGISFCMNEEDSPVNISAVISCETPGAATGLYNEVRKDFGAQIPEGLTTDGNLLVLKQPTGAPLPADVANKFKDANIGFYMNAKQISPFDYVLLCFDTDKLEYKITVQSPKGVSIFEVFAN